MGKETGELLEAALSYQKRGWSVFPINSRTKRPLVEWKAYQEKAASQGQIKEWWTENPHAGIGLATGKVSSLIVLDVDGEEGKKYIKDKTTSLTPCVKTKRGEHYYFRHPGFSTQNFAKRKGLDLRADGGFVILPPSKHPSGTKYEWVVSPEEELASPPDWLLGLIARRYGGKTFKPSMSQKELDELMEGVEIGERHYTATRIAGHYIGSGFGKIAVLGILKKWNARNSPPLKDEGVLERMVDDFVGKRIEERGEPNQILQVKAVKEEIEGFEKSTFDFAKSDIGNAERLVAFFGQRLAYCHQEKKWFIWNGSYWKGDDVLEIQNLMQHIVKQVGIAASYLNDTTKRKIWWNFCTTSSTSHRIAGAISLARSNHAVAHIASDFDTDHYLLNVRNGTVDLRTGVIRPFERSDFITKMANVTYDSKAKCPLWDSFLDYFMGGNQDLISFLHKAAGYSFTADARERLFFILYGGGDNGKSTFLSVLRHMLGDYACEAPATLLYATQYEKHPTSLARLRGKRLVIATETEEDKRLAEGLIKQLTTGEGKENMVAHFMRQDEIEFPPLMKVWFGTNHKPKIRGTDKAIWNRIRLIPFSIEIPKEEQILDYSRKLEPEFSGILNKILQGCVGWWKSRRLEQPKEVKDATSEYRSEEDIVANFIRGAMIIDSGAATPSSIIYRHYLHWCKITGERRPITQNSLGRRLGELGYNREKPGGVSSRCGLRTGNIDEVAY